MCRTTGDEVKQGLFVHRNAVVFCFVLAVVVVVVAKRLRGQKLGFWWRSVGARCW